ncbi:damage-control phosphatase ARMT1 family protein [Marinoscillum sp. MHG1-6]|uniref:damage-control phosphatase ARMT1 family protein n=1 Tax=Marinoscillum sp. MHG1-6 TaxID=2959627 RepID=UPI002157C478|nr:damage-control phosphatase ARMT1 family protein [Marinoscillum sp. MHG1-6]
MILQDYPYLNITEDSFADFTFKQRVPLILQEIIDQEWPKKVKSNLIDLLNAGKKLKVKGLVISSSQSVYWENFFENYARKSLDDIPFFFAEVYWYQYLLTITCYEENGIDPFAGKKKQELEDSIHQYTEMLSLLDSEDLSDVLLLCLGGNKADLSQLKRQQNELKLLTDHREQLLDSLHANRQVHILLDNAGTELFTDLLLSWTLMKNKKCSKVILHAKAAPIFVSDTIPEDIDMLLRYLYNSGKTPLIQFAKEIRDLLDKKMIKIVPHPFWNSPNHFTSVPQEINNMFGSNDLLISKGDANYRRFYEDREIPSDFSGAAKITNHQFALRTLKSQIITELDSQTAQDLTKNDPNWMINGAYAVIQELR